MPRDVAVVGPLNVDLLISGEAPSSFEELTRWEGPADIQMTAAGSVGYLAQDLARLGLDVGLVSCLPDDQLGAFQLDTLRRAGVAVDRVRLVPETVETASLDGNQRKAEKLMAQTATIVTTFDRLRNRKDPIEPDPDLDLASGFLYQRTGERPDAASARALDAYLIVGAEHGLNASTFTARVIISTRSDIASAICGAIGALKGPLHGGAPAEVVSQLLQIGSPERAEQWIDEAFERGERLMGFGHRVYRAYDPRAAALREVAAQMGSMADWLSLAVAVEDIALRKLAERYPERPLLTNVEYYTAAVLQGVGLPPDLFPATFAV